MRVFLVVAGLLTLGGLAIPSSAEDYSDRYNFDPPWHWARDGELRIGLEYGPGVDVALLGSVAAAWSQSEAIEMGVIGAIADERACSDETAYHVYNQRGVITVCLRPDLSTSSAGSATECNLHIGTNCTHVVSSKVQIRANTQRLMCHEIGHTIGLAHGGDGCMAALTRTDCPGSNDLGALANLYSHDDGYTTALQTEMWKGTPNCGSGAEPTATNTPKPTSTPRPKKTPPGRK